MPVSKEKEQFVRHAGNAIVALFGVNDITDFHDIHQIRKLIKDAHESHSFMKMHINKKVEDPDESEYCSRMSEFWGSEFAKKYLTKKTQVKGAIWDLYILKKYISQVESELKFAINNFTTDKADEY